MIRWIDCVDALPGVGRRSWMINVTGHTIAAASKNGLKPMVRVVGMSAAGVAPRVMGIGPVPASRKVLDRAGLTIDQMAVIELNKAFASPALATGPIRRRTSV